MCLTRDLFPPCLGLEGQQKWALPQECPSLVVKIGGAEGDRTPDLMTASLR